MLFRPDYKAPLERCGRSLNALVEPACGFCVRTRMAWKQKGCAAGLGRHVLLLCSWELPPLALEVLLATLLGPSLASARLWLTLPCLIRHAVLACSPRGHCPTVGAPSTMRKCGRRRPRAMRSSGTARQASVVSHAHVLDRGQHLLPILAQTDHDEERDRGRLAVEPQNGWLMRGRPP